VRSFVDQEDVAQGIDLVGQAGDLAVSSKRLERLVVPERLAVVVHGLQGAGVEVQRRRPVPCAHRLPSPALVPQVRWWQARSSRQEVALCHDDYGYDTALLPVAVQGWCSRTAGSDGW
jgi:hypothetical protein